MIISLIACLVILTGAILLFLRQAQFGALPKGERLKRIKSSPHYRDGQFHNQSPTVLMAKKSRLAVLLDFLFVKVNDLRPKHDLPVVKTDLKGISLQEEVLIWFGHSSLYIQLQGQRILVDPVLISASPVSFLNKAFKGTNRYHPDDFPEIDILLLTHDHWDHLDYGTLISLRERIKSVVCPLGLGAHLERWGFLPQQITELDWNQGLQTAGNIRITALPARHFSGRSFRSNKSLWAGYMLQSLWGNIYLSGDTGYDTHFEAVKKRFGTIDLAIMENGQYNENWPYIHMLPANLVKAVKDLQPRHLLTVHHSKYALARHPWFEPLAKIAATAHRDGLPLHTPRIGEILPLSSEKLSNSTIHLPDTTWWE